MLIKSQKKIKTRKAFLFTSLIRNFILIKMLNPNDFSTFYPAAEFMMFDIGLSSFLLSIQCFHFWYFTLVRILHFFCVCLRVCMWKFLYVSSSPSLPHFLIFTVGLRFISVIPVIKAIYITKLQNNGGRQTIR